MSTGRAKLRVRPKKSDFVGAPAIFHLSNACLLINKAFGGFGCYLVGSALERPDFRDVDVRFIMEDAEFDKLFPCASPHVADSFINPRWSLICSAISELLRKQTGLPVDFQIQKQSHANKRYGFRRHPLGIFVAQEEPKD